MEFLSVSEAASDQPSGPLAGKVALVTGAGKRIGRAIALRLALAGADVAITYLGSQAEAEATVREIA
jgi:NAD(P)-dependent dehydrogenase (short-subunit alcohol dehydrogenase family)